MPGFPCEVAPWQHHQCSGLAAYGLFHDTKRSNIFLVIHFDEAVCGTHQGQPHFDFMIGTGMSAGTAWTSAVLIKGWEDPYFIATMRCQNSDIEKVVFQSDRDPASEVVMRVTQSTGALMNNSACEIIQQQSQ